MLIFQSLLLITLSYLIGCLSGGVLRKLATGKTEPRYVALDQKKIVELEEVIEEAINTVKVTEIKEPPKEKAEEKEEIVAKVKPVATKTAIKNRNKNKLLDDVKEKTVDIAIKKSQEEKAAKADEEGVRPKVLKKALGQGKDNLRRIKGVGPKNEDLFNGLGIFHFAQIAALSDEEVRWIGSFLSFKGRIEREDWVQQAALLASGEETDFSKRVDKGDVASSKKK